MKLIAKASIYAGPDRLAPGTRFDSADNGISDAEAETLIKRGFAERDTEDDSAEAEAEAKDQAEAEAKAKAEADAAAAEVEAAAAAEAAAKAAEAAPAPATAPTARKSAAKAAGGNG